MKANVLPDGRGGFTEPETAGVAGVLPPFELQGEHFQRGVIQEAGRKVGRGHAAGDGQRHDGVHEFVGGAACGPVEDGAGANVAV